RPRRPSWPSRRGRCCGRGRSGASAVTDPLFGVRREPAILGPGAVHVPDWLSREQQEFLLRACAGWASVAAPRSIVLPGGGRMSVRTFSLGRHWSPYRYDDDNADVPPIPEWLVRAARSGLAAAAAVDPRVAGPPPTDQSSSDQPSSDQP